ncbi:MAG: hypothetical protein JNL45_16550 [Hyphomicrobium sp.]|jgi:hypothetical protein|nr:hypothetical protein [Hyphomicrobium sp.]
MTGMTKTVEEMLSRLENNSKSELSLVRALAEAIRRVDDQMLHELRNLSLQHELRRESILDELQTLATRLCHLPARPTPSAIRAAIDQPALAQKRANAETVDAGDVVGNGTGADWRQAAQNIQDDLDFAFSAPPPPRH